MLEDLLALGQTAVPDAGRYLISPSRPAADCSLLAVWQAGVTATSSTKNGCQILSRVELHITLFSCTPTQQRTGKPPTAEAVTAATEHFVDQGYAIWRALVQGATSGTLFNDPGVGCGEVDLTQGQRAIDASGGEAGWDFAIFVALT